MQWRSHGRNWRRPIARGVGQCVVIGSQLPAGEADLRVYQVAESTGSLASALEGSGFDRLKATLVVWLGGAGYRTADAALSTLGFIASLPRGSGVVFDYAVERSSALLPSQTALDALASRVADASGAFKLLIQPQAVAAMLKGMGFRQILDLAQEETAAMHLVSAVL